MKYVDEVYKRNFLSFLDVTHTIVYDILSIYRSLKCGHHFVCFRY